MNKGRALAGAAIALAAFWLTGRRSSSSSSAGLGLEKVAGVPFAGGGAPIWPVLSKGPDRFSIGYVTEQGEKHGNQSRRFGATRDNGSRRHAGIDLYAKAGDIVVAAESGVVTMVRDTFAFGTGILFLRTDSGITLAYGEVDPKSWNQFNVKTGTRVTRGQKLARVGCMSKDAQGDCDSQMLHFETYRGTQTKNQSWYTSKGPPADLLNPTAYLLRARASTSA